MIQNMDSLPWVADVYKRDLQIEKYFIGYLLHPYVSLYTGRGCPAHAHFAYGRRRSADTNIAFVHTQNVADEMAYMKKLFPQVREFFFDDDTFTATFPALGEIAKKTSPVGLTWSCTVGQTRLRYHQSFRIPAAPVPGRLRKRQRGYSDPNQKGVTMDEMRRFTKSCHQAGVVIHAPSFSGCQSKHRSQSRIPSVRPGTRRVQHPGFLAAPYPAPSSSRWPDKTVVC